MEIWKDVAHEFWAQYYQVSNTGKMRSKDRVGWLHSPSGSRYKRSRKGRELHSMPSGVFRVLRVDFFVTMEDGSKKQTQVFIHREVMRAFSPAPEGVLARRKRVKGTNRIKETKHPYKYVEHIDGDYANNHVENLRWITMLDIHEKIPIAKRPGKMDFYKYAPNWQNRKIKT